MSDGNTVLPEGAPIFLKNGEVVYRRGDSPHDPVPWRQAEEGDWALTDDGYVVRFLWKKVYRSGNLFMRFMPGAVWVTKHAKLEFEPYHKYGRYSQVNPSKNPADHILGRKSVKLAIQRYIQYVLNEEKPDWLVLGRMAFPRQKHQVFRAIRLFNTSTVLRKVAQSIRSILDEMDIDDRYVVRKVVAALDLAEEEKNPSAMLNAAKLLGQYRGIDRMEQVRRDGFGEIAEWEYDTADPARQLAEKSDAEEETAD